MATASSGYNCRFINNALQHLAIDGVEITEAHHSVGPLETMVEGKWVGAPCAIKRLRTEDVTEYLSDRFLYECTLWSELKHPNVLQFYGLYFPIKDGYPVIVTELLQYNLHQYLKAHSRAAVPLTTKACILRDVALAVRYLHSLKPPTIIRELSASFVYLTPGLMAKLGEFGSATKLTNGDKEGLDHCQPQLTATLPVTGSCSWPEPYSSFASDAFSFGDFILHVLLHTFPEPDSKIRMAGIGSDRCEVLTELQRREKYLVKLAKLEKTFQPILAQCYEDVPKARPSFTHICTSLELIITHLNGTSLQSSRNARDAINHLQLQHESERIRVHLPQSQSHQSDKTSSPVAEPVDTPVRPHSTTTRAYRPPADTGNLHHQTAVKSPHINTHGKTSNASRTHSSFSKTVRYPPSTSNALDSTPEDDGKTVNFHSSRASKHVVSPITSSAEIATSPPLRSKAGRGSQGATVEISSCTSSNSQTTAGSTPISPTSVGSASSSSSTEVVSPLDTRKPPVELFTYALLRKNYKDLKRGEKVMISPGAWDADANSCTVHSECTSVCENIHPASKYLEVLRPITDEPWFTQMGREDVEEHMQKEHILNGSFLVLRGGSKGYALAVKYSGKTHFFQIFYNADQTFSLNRVGTPNFVTISELVKEYSQKKMGLATLLTVPYISMRMELPHESFSMDEEVHQGKNFVVWSGKFAPSQGTSTTPVAVKTIMMDKDQRKSSTAALYNESSILNFILRSGGHRNILKMLGICVQRKQPHLIVELCYQINLQQILYQHADLYTNKHLTYFASQVGSAMAFLEEKDIVHRQLKAANVLVTKDAECKLSGFHCALTTAKANEGSVVKEYATTANPRWAAPEVYTAEAQYTSKSDVWSFGMLLIELFTHGLEPYHGVGNPSVRALVMSGVLPKIPHTCPHNMQSLIAKCLQRTASQRPSLTDVRKVLAN